jgi:hypothetical protein
MFAACKSMPKKPVAPSDCEYESVKDESGCHASWRLYCSYDKLHAKYLPNNTDAHIL